TYVDQLRLETDRVERELLEVLSSREEELQLIAGCLLAETFWDSPERLVRLLEGIAAKGPMARKLTSFEEHVMRAAALLQDPAVPPLLRGRYQLRRGDREVSVYEAIRLVTRLIGGEMPAVWFTEAVAEEDRAGFEASFVLREKAGGGDRAGFEASFVLREKAGGGDESSVAGALDLFFSARARATSAVFYYRRGGHGKQAIVAIDAIRPDSLLKRMFKVFHTDQLKTHRLFAKIARFLNNGFKGLDKKMLWEGLKQLTKEQQIVLALYAPRLGKYIEKRAKFPGLYRLSKFLHRNVTDKKDEGKAAHEKVFEQREIVSGILEVYGRETFKKFCRYVFRIAEATPQGPQWSDLIFKIGEVGYFLTAVEGFNPAGLELSLRGKNPIAFIAYGMQPKAKTGPERRLVRLQEVRSRFRSEPDSEVRDDLLHAIDVGLTYLAWIHGFDDIEALEAGAKQRT
ncbi:MAG: hypothetical protein ACYS22_18800, partial [Planctomycetota bacterium]